MSNRVVFFGAFFSALIFVLALAAGLSTPGKKYDACEAKGVVAVRTTTSWVCARLEVIK